MFVYLRALGLGGWGRGDLSAQRPIGGSRCSVDVTRSGGWLLEMVARVVSVCRGRKKLRAPHLQVVLEGENLRLGMEVGHWCGPYASSGDAQCCVLRPLHHLHVRLSQVRNPGHTGVCQYRSDKLPLEGREGLLEVAERCRSQGLYDVQSILGSGCHDSNMGSEGQNSVQSDTKNLGVGTYRDCGVKESNPWLQRVLSVEGGDQSV